MTVQSTPVTRPDCARARGRREPPGPFGTYMS